MKGTLPVRFDPATPRILGELHIHYAAANCGKIVTVTEQYINKQSCWSQRPMYSAVHGRQSVEACHERTGVMYMYMFCENA
ncbi:hypothetical protein DPMN_118916 [Dreissena polymorpha]|uniref:Uncharacterized protein n=1 Tax=Dreissena polymorpha TaxID=45954 RepID=A0A9D4GNZ3_DREPO|nr:hypothetical protein DPMN_118916 [Dreissena polymorpha]